MGWRDALWEKLVQAEGNGERVEMVAALMAMPPGDRVALARELLAGTDHVAMHVPSVTGQLGYQPSPEARRDLDAMENARRQAIRDASTLLVGQRAKDTP